MSVPEPAAGEIARRIAGEIRRRRGRLDEEDRLAADPRMRNYRRAWRRRDRDRAQVEGMVTALCYALGCPGDVESAEVFIAAQPPPA